jgi:hypothetical protein
MLSVGLLAIVAAVLAATLYAWSEHPLEARSSNQPLRHARPPSRFALLAGGGKVDDREVGSIGRALQQASVSGWSGESHTTSDGDQVWIYESDFFVNDPGYREYWASFLSWLPHGDEMNGLQLYIAPLGEVQAICGAAAVGCYSDSDNDLIIPADDGGGVPVEQVLAHEYGHRIAAHRLNSPWPSAQYGPKYWATDANVCQRVAQGSAYPGNEGVNYANNPGEAFAETYREFVASLATDVDWGNANVPFLTRSFPNDADAQAAVAEDVYDGGWRGPEKATWRGALKSPVVAKRVHKSVVVHGRRALEWKTVRMRAGVPKPALFSVDTPLDGDLEASIENAPSGASLSVLDSSGTTVIGPVGVQQASFTVCGQRSITLRLNSSKPGSFRVSLSAP